MDRLTGTLTHGLFHDALARVANTAAPVSLLMIDVDRFSSFNDTFGHASGDTVLQAVANALRSVTRKADAVARYGGEEFAVLAADTDADAALALAERIRREVESIPSLSRAVTVSIGVSTQLGAGGSGAALLKQADAALYIAKSGGRNRVAHHRHARASIDSPAAQPCKTQCAPSPTGCLKCEVVPASSADVKPALLLGPQDADAANTLRDVLDTAGLTYRAIGPVLVVPDVRHRLSEIEALFKSRLSPVTQASVTAAYVRNGLTTSDQVMHALLVARPLSELVQDLEHEWIREALGDGWLFSVFHPILNARSGELFGQEALLRARDPHTGKILGAGQIINACDKLKLQHQLDQLARKAAIYGAAEHVGKTERVFINFLPNTIYDPAICLRTTIEAAARCGLEMSRLVFEVVETEKIPDMSHLLKVLDYYRERGMGTAIDDMGAGFTGVDYITSLKPNFVKLDREFVLAAEASLEGRLQMDLIISASQRSGARVIAEGIETEAQMDLCVNAGVDLLQGFLFAKPACPPQAISFPATRRRAA